MIRRSFLKSATAITLLPFAARAASHSSDSFATASGEITVHPIQHASFVMQTPGGTLYCDPVGDPGLYANLPAPDLVLVTHAHGDHFNNDTLSALATDQTKLITNPSVYTDLSSDLQANANQLSNGEQTDFGDINIEAIPAYNTTEGRLNYHPQGRDNGYVLTIDGIRIYIAGDTEDIPEMRALTDITLAFVPMNLPYTMDVTQAASAVAAFGPKYVYPYHYQGSDIDDFDAQVGATSDVKRGAWYS